MIARETTRLIDRPLFAPLYDHRDGRHDVSHDQIAVDVAADTRRLGRSSYPDEAPPATQHLERARPRPSGQRAVRGGLETQRHGGKQASPRPVGTTPLRTEELRVRKVLVETGQVGIGKRIVAEPRAIEVPVTHRGVVVEHHPVRRRPSDHRIGRQAIRIPVREERVSVEKRPVVYEEVGVVQRPLLGVERVSAVVRREVATVTAGGDVRLGQSKIAADQAVALDPGVSMSRVGHQHQFTRGRCRDCGAL